MQSSATREQVASYPVEAARVAPITSPSDVPADPRLGPETPVEGLGNPDGTFNLGLTHRVKLPVNQDGAPLFRVLAYSNIVSANTVEMVQVAARDFDPLQKSTVAILLSTLLADHCQEPECLHLLWETALPTIGFQCLYSI